MLQNEVYTGVYKVSTMEGESPCPAIIDAETFEKVQQRAEVFRTRRRERKKGVRFMLTGKMTCGHCERSVHGSGQGKFLYYHCPGCKYNIRADKLEDLVLTALREYLTADKISELAGAAYKEYQKESNGTDERELLEQQIASTDRLLQNAVRAVLNGLDSETVRNTISDMEKKKKELQESLEALNETHPVLTEKHFRFALQKIIEKATNVESVQQLVDTVVNKIIIYEKQAIICINLTDESNVPPMEQILVRYKDTDK